MRDLSQRRAKDREISQQERKKKTTSPDFAKKPKDLWVKPTQAKYPDPTPPPGQEANFRYRQSAVMRIRDLALAGRAEEALTVFKNEVCVNQKERIDEFTYNQLLLACSRSGKWNLGFKTYNDMKKRAVKPSIITVTNLLQCLASVRYPTKDEQVKYTRQKVEYIAAEMEKHNLQPNTQSYNVLLQVLSVMDDLPSALRLVNEMQLNPEVEVDDTTYTLLVNAFGPDNFAGIFGIWDDLKEKGIRASAHFYHAMMKYCNIHKKPELTLEISLEMKKEAVPWDQRTISLLCTAYGLLGQSSYAGALLRKVDENCIPMDPILWNSLLRLGSMKAWTLKGGSPLSDISSSQSLVDELEKRLIASKAAPSTVEKDLNLLKSEEIEALLLASLNCALPEHATRYHQALLGRRKNYTFTDHYQTKYDRLCSQLHTLKE